MSVFHSDLFRQQALIAGSWRDAADGTTLAVSNPSTGATLGQIPNMGRAEAQQAVDAAAAALPDWRALTAAQRAALLKNWHRLILENKTALAQIMTAEQGKPLAEAEGEIAYAASFIEWFSEQGKRANGEIIPSPGADKRLMVIRQGVGVCAAITPWNFPAAMITRKAGPALAAGCT
ncbi:aldehyde dehydrogenase family protein, partial [Klebsiella pneumoniae]